MIDTQRLQVSVAEAAHALGVCRGTLYKMKAEGQIAFTKVRGRTLVPVSELKRISDVATRVSVGEAVVEPRKLIIKKRKLFPKLRQF